MRRMRFFPRRFGATPLYIRLMCFLLGFATVILLVDMRIRPVIKGISSYQAKVYATKVINDAIYSELAKENIRYDNLVSLTQNNIGEITSLQTDMVALNRLRSRATDAVLQQISTMNNQHIYIALGTLTGLQLLSGRGPELSIKIVPAGYLQTELENRFDSAGINQTRHQIMLKMDMRVSAIIPGFSVSTDIHTEFCLAETVIIGVVPDAFTQVTGDSDSLTRQIFDYRANGPATNLDK